jgi:thiamine phosphate synthase YjbQ (UPF0047 family)
MGRSIWLKQKIGGKNLRLRTRESRRLLTTTQELKELINNNKNGCIQTFLQGLTSTEFTDYSLWKATKKTKKITKLRRLGHHEELWQDATLEKHTFSLNTWQKIFSCIPQKMNPKIRTSRGIWNHQSTVSRELKFKETSAV